MLSSTISFAAPRQEHTVCHPGVQQLARGDFRGALKSLSTVTSLSSTPVALLHGRGLAELMNGRIDDAIATFDQVLKQDPSFEEARFNRGIARLQKGDGAGATSDFEAVYAREASPLRARAAYHAALASDAMKNAAAAEQWLRRSIAVDPQTWDAHLYLGVLLERQQKFQEAGRAYKEYLSANPDSVIAALRFGVVAQRAGYLDAARTHLLQVIQKAPSSGEAAQARKLLVMWE